MRRPASAAGREPGGARHASAPPAPAAAWSARLAPRNLACWWRARKQADVARPRPEAAPRTRPPRPPRPPRSHPLNARWRMRRHLPTSRPHDLTHSGRRRCSRWPSRPPFSTCPAQPRPAPIYPPLTRPLPDPPSLTAAPHLCAFFPRACRSSLSASPLHSSGCNALADAPPRTRQQRAGLGHVTRAAQHAPPSERPRHLPHACAPARATQLALSGLWPPGTLSSSVRNWVVPALCGGGQQRHLEDVRLVAWCLIALCGWPPGRITCLPCSPAGAPLLPGRLAVHVRRCAGWPWVGACSAGACKCASGPPAAADRCSGGRPCLPASRPLRAGRAWCLPPSRPPA